MDPSNFGAFQHQIQRNQAELIDYLKDLESWKENISKKDQALKSNVENKDNPDDAGALPPVRNSLHKKRKVKKRKGGEERKKSSRIPGSDFRAWDKFDVDKALMDVDNESEHSSYEEETDEEWEEERLKQQAIFEKDQGNDYFKKGKFDEAIECYTKGITCDPTNAVLYANRAMALLKQEKYGAVEKDCTDALALDPTYIKAYLRRATARKQLKKLESALDDFRQVVKLEPSNKVAISEVASLEQALKISKEGIVLPIKKTQKERSKKPLVRIQIEEIDHDDVKSRLSEAIAKTTAQQSSEKKKIVAKDNEMFSKFTQGNSKTSAQSNKELPSPTANTTIQSPATSFASPADIGKSQQPLITDISNDAVNSENIGTKATPKDSSSQPTLPTKVKSSTAKESNKNQTSPRESTGKQLSPRAPANSFQFQRDWKTVKNDLDASYEYLKKIPPSQYAKLFGESLEAGVMTKILNIFNQRFIRDGVDITDHLINLSKVKRFGMTVMLMSPQDKSTVQEIIKKLLEQPEVKQDNIKSIEKLYEL